MKVFALIVSSVIAGFLGLTLGRMMGDFGICGGAEITKSFLSQVCGLGIAAVIAGAAVGRGLSWIPPAAYSAPLALFGGLFPILCPEWTRVRAAWFCLLVVGFAYAVCLRALGSPSRPDGDEEEITS